MRISTLLPLILVFAILNAIPLWQRHRDHTATRGDDIHKAVKSPTKHAHTPHGKGGKVHKAPKGKHPAVHVETKADDHSSSAGDGSSLFEVFQESADQLTGPQLLQGYEASRSDRACDPLPSNVTVELERDFRLGTVFEMYRPGSSADQRHKAKKAYVLMVSNHKYIDGALVMGDSLRSTSDMVKQGEALLMILVNEKINNATLRQLTTVFDIVKVMRTTATFSPKSYYKTTFDKMYLFWLTEFERVIFFDADSYALGNTDHLFKKLPPGTDHYVTAVGGHEYFQTALLVVRPDRQIFTDIYLEYRYGPFQYNQWRARDGILLRNCFLKKHKNIGHPKEIHHYYGYTKPWFNKDVKHKRAKEKLTFDEPYRKWWHRYEKLHKEYFVDMSLKEMKLNPKYVYGSTALKAQKTFGLPNPPVPASKVDPHQYMWLQRFSVGSEYLRPTFEHYEELRDNHPQGLKVVLSEKGATSCDDVCSTEGGEATKCRDDALQLTSVNSCKAMKELTNCSRCEEVSGRKAAPLMAGSTCSSNFLHDLESLPLCNATAEGKQRRICACFSF